MASRFASAAVAALALVLTATASAGPSTARDNSSQGRSGPGPAALAAAPAYPSLATQRIYFVMTDRYANGDASNDSGGARGTRDQTGYDPTDPGYYHGGDLKGLLEQLPRIKALGFTAIWVTPVVKQQWSQAGSASYHGYWGLDFTTVDPHLGSDADFTRLVGGAHALGLKVYLDVVVNHTADVVRLTGTSYSDVPYRDCRGKRFDPARYVYAKRFPCLKAVNMPRVPFVLPADRKLKKPAWLNDPLNYHDRGDIDFGSCSETCFEQGDFFGLDDLFTEKPNVANGLAQVFASWVERFKVDGFRVDTARHVNRAFFKLWVPKVRAAARRAGIADFPIFGEVFLSNAVDVAPFVRDRGLPTVLDFPFQAAATSFASGASGAKAVSHRLDDDDYFRLGNGVAPVQPTFLGNHDMGRAAMQIKQKAGGATGDVLLRRTLLAYDLLFLSRGAPTVYYGDEVGMVGTGGDKAARQDMFPTQVTQWQTEERVGSPPVGKGSSFDVTANPIELRIKALSALRDANPALATGASVVRYANGPVLVVSRVDVASGRELVTAFNAGTAAVRVTVPGIDACATCTPLFGGGSVSGTTLNVPGLSSLVYEPIRREGVPVEALPAPKLTAGEDDLTDYVRLAASTPVRAATVTFATRRGKGAWRRVAIDDAPPFRAFLSPGAYRRREKVQAVAIVRDVRGKTAVSRVLTFVPHR